MLDCICPGHQSRQPLANYVEWTPAGMLSLYRLCGHCGCKVYKVGDYAPGQPFYV